MIEFMTRSRQLQALLDALNRDTADTEQDVLVERLRERATKYATPQLDTRPTADDMLRLISFQLGDERYAVDVATVAGIRPVMHVTRVPGTPSFYRGVTNIRGQIVSVLDLRLFFGMTAAMLALPAELILVENDELHIALLVKRVEALIELSPASLKTVELPYAQGITPEHLIILDIPALLDDERLIIGGHSS